MKIKNVFHGRNNITCSTYTEELQHYYTRNMVWFRYVIVHTLKNVMKRIIIIIIVTRKYYENYSGCDSLRMLLTITI